MNPNQNPQPPLPPQPTQQPVNPQVVHISRAMEPAQPEITPATRQKHEDSKARYPQLNLSDGEFIISAVKRHPFGLFQLWFISGFLIAVLVTFIALLMSDPGGSVSSLNADAGNSLPLLTIPLLLAVVIILIGGAIGTFVFQANSFFLTNESVIQNVQSGLFSKRLQTVSLGNVEDASYTQNGVVPHILNFGSIRLSTQGDETTYRFNYASQPEKQIALLNNAVEAFKNGRPVEGNYS